MNLLLNRLPFFDWPLLDQLLLLGIVLMLCVVLPLLVRFINRLEQHGTPQAVQSKAAPALLTVTVSLARSRKLTG